MTKVRFDLYTFDPATGELSSPGGTTRLPHKAAEVLTLLVSRPGELVTRAELRSRLWDSDTFVDFDNNLNVAVRRLRAALDDSAESPRFIETLTRRGYRFVADVTAWLEPASASARPEDDRLVEASHSPADAPIPAERRRSRWRWAPAHVAGLVLAAGLAILAGTREAPVPVIAVAPFVNLSGDPAQNHISDGLTAELTTQLALRRTYRVVSQTRVDASTTPDFVVEGSARRDGNGLFVTARVVRRDHGEHVWAGAFECPQGDSAAIERQLAVKIASAVADWQPVLDAFGVM